MEENRFEEYMHRMAEGDRDSLREIYECYRKLIFSVCMNQLRHRESAEDVTADFFIRLFQSARTFRPNGHHKAWMITIAKNMCVDYMRKNGREIPILDTSPGDEDDGPAKEVSADTGPEGESPLFHREKPSLAEEAVNRLTLAEAMRRLTPMEKEIIDLKIAGGFTFREIAETLNMPQGTVSWHYNEGMKKLRRYCQDE